MKERLRSNIHLITAFTFCIAGIINFQFLNGMYLRWIGTACTLLYLLLWGACVYFLRQELSWLKFTFYLHLIPLVLAAALLLFGNLSDILAGIFFFPLLILICPYAGWELYSLVEPVWEIALVTVLAGQVLISGIVYFHQKRTLSKEKPADE